jgi:phosphatidyl-myo-inositol dimannoside synthase
MDLRGRNAKARKIEELLNIVPGEQPLKVLEIGTGSGGIANYFGRHPILRCDVDAVDVSDTRRVHDGYKFFQVKDVHLPFSDDLYDIVISNHVIEHVGDIDAQRCHLAEMRRVLKPAGQGYLAVPNRWQVVEPHYQVAFLSWLPEAWRSPYLRMRGRGVDYDCRPLTVSVLECLLPEAGFHFHHEHGRALKLTYEIERPDDLIYRVVFSHLPDVVYKRLRRAFPTLIYILHSTQGA